MYAVPRTRSALRALAAAGLVVLAGACGGGGDAEQEVAASVDEVDQESPAAPTEREEAAFTPPADSVLTTAQVDAFLKTALLQFDYIRNESKGLHERAQRLEERNRDGGGNVVAGLRDMADATSLIVDFGNVIGGSYVRAARTLGYNPAEMQWVSERMSEVAGYLASKPLLEQSVGYAATMRQTAEQFRGQPGFTDEQIQEMLRNADETERQAREQMNASGAVARNMEVLHRARPEVTDPMWASVAMWGGGGAGLALGGLADPQDTTAQRHLNEWRQVYTDALNNRVTPGMEADKPLGSRPRPTPEAAAEGAGR